MPYLSPYIETMRTKSDSAKQRFALLVAFIITFVIFFVWLSTLQLNTATPVASEEVVSSGPVTEVGGFLGKEWARVKLGAQSVFNLLERRVIVK